jgi:lipopolysaccharide transport system permease protein
MRHFSTSPIEMTATLWRNRELIFEMTKREVVGRYRGSFMGLAWSIVHPLIMLVIYTFVFGVVFRARWDTGSPTESVVNFALLLFVGMILHGVFGECINRAPTLILANANYVKKVVFPLEILPFVAMASAMFHGGISLLVMIAVQLIANHGFLPWTVLLFPFVLLPLLCTTIGMAWLLSSLGVYIRDIVQVTGFLTTILLFISPVFFPVSAVPAALQNWMKLNPLTFVIESGRNVLIFGRAFDWLSWVAYVGGGFVVAWVGFCWFQKTRRGFADVI